MYQIHTVFYFAMHWELFHPIRVFNWPDAIQTIIRIIEHKWFPWVSVWIYVICGELVGFYFQRTTYQLNFINIAAKKLRVNQKHVIHLKTFAVLRSLKELNFATEFLHRRLSSMFLAICCMSFVTMLTSSYYVIEFIFIDKQFMTSCWEGFTVFDSFLRFFFICHTSDRMRKAV